jgi:hypothetical protein
MSSTRIAGVAGVLGFVAAAAGNVAPGHIFEVPGTHASAAEITNYLAADRTSALVAMLLNTAAVTLWVAFGAGVWVRLRDATGGESLLSACFAFAFVAFVTLIFAGFVPFMVLVYRGHSVTDAKLLYDLTFGLLAMSAAPTALALWSYAAIVLRTGAFPRWTAWLAVIGADAHVVLLASFVVTGGFFSLQGQVITAIPATLFVWILGTGVAMLRSGERAAVGVS